MNPVCRLGVIALALAPAIAVATPYDMKMLRIDLPDGFEGPVIQHPDARSTATAFVKRYPGDTRGTLLMITIYDSGGQLKSMPEATRTSTTDTYLGQMMDGVARKRTAFKSSSPTHLRIGGVLASRESWNGMAQGRSISGTMYCAIVGDQVVVFHTQDFDDAPPANRAQAVRAIESVAFTAK